MEDGTATARRIERAEAAQMERTLRASGTGDALRIAGGLSAWTGPRSPFSVAIGCGLEGPVTSDEVDAIEAHLGRDGDPVRIEVSAFADPSLGVELGRRGYALDRFQLVWARPPLPAPEAPAAEVRAMRPDEEDLWIDLFARAFWGGPAAEAMRDGLLAMPRGEGNVCFLALADGMPAAVAMASAEGGVAQLTGAGVAPRFRGRGLQLALVRTRLAWAAERGCDLAASASDPGTASQRTLERAGFRLAYPKAVLVRQLP